MNIAQISVVQSQDEIRHGINLFSLYLQKKWGIRQESVYDLVEDEFNDKKSVLLKAESFGKFIGVVCVAPFNIINFPDAREKQKILCFFEEKKIKPCEVVHIGGLGLDHNNSMVDLTWWSRFLIFSALKVGSSEGWKYVVGQSKENDTVVGKIARMFRFREISPTTFYEGVFEKWFLKSLA